MATGVTEAVGVVVADVANPFFASLVSGAEQELRTNGIDCLVANTGEDMTREAEVVEALLRRQVDGIIISSAAGMNEKVPHLESARKLGVPIVLFDRSLRYLDAPTVVLDNVGAARRATELLLDLGHREIALIWGASMGDDPLMIPQDALSTSIERFQGYREALTSRGMDVKPGLVAPRPSTLSGSQAPTRVLDGPERPTAILAVEADATLATLKGLRHRLLSCPGDLSLVAFDDAPWTELTDPPLTVVQQPSVEMGRVAAVRLQELMAARSSSSTSVDILPEQLIVRGSAAPLV
ncbi:MAG: substrate-binding domain-containing protein [Scrofimicrobium sp.]